MRGLFAEIINGYINSEFIKFDMSDIFIFVDTLPITGLVGKVYVTPIDENNARMQFWDDVNDEWVVLGSFQPIPSVSVPQPSFIKSYLENNESNVFTLPKLPDLIWDVYVLEGDDAFYYLRNTEYSVSGDNITIITPTMTDTMAVKINYTSKEV